MTISPNEKRRAGKKTVFEMTDIVTGNTAKGSNHRQVLQRLYGTREARIKDIVNDGHVYQVFVLNNYLIGQCRVSIRDAKK